MFIKKKRVNFLILVWLSKKKTAHLTGDKKKSGKLLLNYNSILSLISCIQPVLIFIVEISSFKSYRSLKFSFLFHNKNLFIFHIKK